MKVALICDTHCGVNNSSEYFIEQQDKFYSHVFFPYLLEHNINHIIHLGDYYDNRKALNVRAIQANRKHFLQPLADYGMTMDAIVGNHDIYYKNTNKVNSLKELLGNYSNINIIEDPVNTVISETEVCLIPWITPENASDVRHVVKASNAEICLGHFEFAGFKMYKNDDHGFRGDSIETKLFKKFNKVLSGHFHTKSKKGNIQYLGSSMEFNWSDYNDPKFFHILDLKTNALEAVRNPVNIYHEIEYDDDILPKDLKNIENKIVRLIPLKIDDRERYELIFDHLKEHAYNVSVRLPKPKTETDAPDVETMTDTLTLMKNYVEGLDTKLDKTKIENILSDLYKNANE